MSGDEPVSCMVCGARRAQQDPVDALGWTLQQERGGARWLCARCSRVHVRDIESKLPSEDW